MLLGLCYPRFCLGMHEDAITARVRDITTGHGGLRAAAQGGSDITIRSMRMS